MDDNKKKNNSTTDSNTNAKKSDRTEFADEINMESKNGKNCK